MNNIPTQGIVVAAALVAMIGIVTTTMTVAAFADRTSGENIADRNIHERTPGQFAGLQDRVFHEGTCQGGSTSVACGFSIITEPGKSDDVRQDN